MGGSFGRCAGTSERRAIKPKVQSCDGKLLIAPTLPDPRVYDRPISSCRSRTRPGRARRWCSNQPNPWWCRTHGVEAGDKDRLWQVFGNNQDRQRDQAAPVKSRNRANQDAGCRDGIAASGKTTPRSSAWK